MTFPSRISLATFAALAFAVAACQEPPQKAAPSPPKVNVSHPKTMDYVENDTYNGWIDAEQTVMVRARVRGHIYKINFTDGEIVKKDQVLFELDPRPFEADVERAKQQLNVYQAQLVAAQKEEARLKDLLTKGGASQSQLDKAIADAGSLTAQVDSAKQEIKSQELNLEYSRVTSPITGRVGRAEMSVGNLVNAGGTDPVLTTIVSVDPVYVYFNVDERSMQAYKSRRKDATERSGALKSRDLKFFFALETEKGFPHEGALDFVDNEVDKKTGTVLVRGAIANPNGLFDAGSRVKVRVPVSEPRPVILVPDTAIQSDQNKKYVLVIDDKNIVQRRDINQGRLLDDGTRIVLDGDKGPVITPNDWLIVQGIQSARINYPVDPIKPGGEGSTPAPAPAAATTTAPAQH